jgi:hypothetical protein
VHEIIFLENNFLENNAGLDLRESGWLERSKEAGSRQ